MYESIFEIFMFILTLFFLFFLLLFPDKDKMQFRATSAALLALYFLSGTRNSVLKNMTHWLLFL